MRDYSAKEIAYYNRMFSVPSVFIPSLETKVSLTDSATFDSRYWKLQPKPNSDVTVRQISELVEALLKFHPH